MREIRKVDGYYLIADIARAIEVQHSNVGFIAYQEKGVHEVLVDGEVRKAIDKETLRKVLNRDWRTSNRKFVMSRCREVSYSIFGEDTNVTRDEKARILEQIRRNEAETARLQRQLNKLNNEEN